MELNEKPHHSAENLFFFKCKTIIKLARSTVKACTKEVERNIYGKIYRSVISHKNNHSSSCENEIISNFNLS